ncbi:MAG: hypothetical protein IKQ75_07285 [Bacteroidales bacterium]|nr:hypothetical protein [Bacteroidales bacterium]MBR6161654.1 hypothetical protein [Bacteroidales bacterium]
MNATIVQWATILSPVISVIIAVFVSWVNSRDVKKQIEAVKELSRQTIDNTSNEVESIKQLSKMQIESSIKQVELEIEKYQLLARQAQQEVEGIESVNKSGLSYNVAFREEAMRQLTEEKPQRDLRLYAEFIQRLNSIKTGLERTQL